MIARIELENWLRFAGKHTVDLKPGAYAVVAERITNKLRSNSTCKTGFLEAVRFAITGWHRKRIDGEWLYSGSEEGGVVVTFTDGTVIGRRREGGDNRVLFARRDEQHKWQRPKQAQPLIDDWLGMSHADFVLVSYLEQKQASYLLNMKSADFMKFLGRLYDMTLLQKAAAGVTGSLRESKTKYEAMRAEFGISARDVHYTLKQAAQRLGLTFDDLCDVSPDEELERIRVMLKRHIEQLQRRRAEVAKNLQAMRDKQHLRLKWEAARDKHDSLKKGIAKLEANMPAKVNPRVLAIAKSNVQEASGVCESARRELNEAKKLVAEGFCGDCPVVEMKCPVADQIQARNAEFVQRVEELTTKFNEAQAAKTALVQVESEAAVARQKIDSAEDQLRWLKTQLAETPLGPEPEEVSHQDISDIDNDEVTEHAAIRALGDAERFIARRDQMEKEGPKLKQELRAQGAAAHVLGPSGAQRAFAQSRVDEIAEVANEALAAAGIEVELRVRLVRDLQEKETYCTACQEYFKSPGDKTCATCGQPRRNRQEFAPGLELNVEGGGVEDLSSVLFQLSASNALRGRLSTPWDTLFCDEPFAHLDPVHAEALVRVLSSTALESFGFRQAFFIAHDRRVMETMPQKIVIVGDHERSWFG